MQDLIKSTLEKYNIPVDVLDRYNEPHRVYHNFDHIESMMLLGKEYDWLSDELILAIIFHDIVYDIDSSTNEEDSVILLEQYYYHDKINKAILSTKTNIPYGDLAGKLNKLDLYPLYADFKTFKDYDDKIFLEYQKYDYSGYKNGRINILREYGVEDYFIDYVANRKVNIGLYAGSFNPFHKGHLNILEKAERIFDKVIIARGKNPEKSDSLFDIPDIIKNRQIIEYYGLLTDCIDSLDYDVTLIRGLRSTDDFSYEKIQYKWLNELKPDIKVISLFCDSEFEHISSSAIRTLERYNKHKKYIL